MGCIDELEATFLPYSYTLLISDKEFPIVTLQSCTSNSHLGFKVNLEKMAATCNIVVYEPELFPALRIRKYDPTSVNVFATAKVIVRALRDAEIMSDIIGYIHSK